MAKYRYIAYGDNGKIIREHAITLHPKIKSSPKEEIKIRKDIQQFIKDGSMKFINIETGLEETNPDVIIHDIFKGEKDGLE